MKFVARILIAILSVYIVSKSFRYLGFEVTGILEDKGPLVRDFFYKLGFYSHVIFGSVALLTGPWQFFKRFRNKQIKLHRTLGKIYIISCLLGSISGFGIAFFASGGIVGKLGFMAAAVFWFHLTFMAYRKIIVKDIPAHEKWMISSFAMTFAAVTLRMWLGILIGLFDLSYINAYTTVAWLSWIPNLLVALTIFQFMNRNKIKTQKSL